MKIGIMGGTFDPVHYGHLTAAKEVRTALSLDSVLFIPTGNPAHKKHYQVTDAIIRYKMLKEVIGDEEGFSLSDMEINRQGETYAIDTLRALHQTYPNNTEFFYIIGADVVAELDTWKSYKEDFALCKFAAVCRPGYSKAFFNASVEKMQSLGATIIPVDISQTDISSREIRQKIAQGQDISEWVPSGVQKIILEEGLYRV